MLISGEATVMGLATAIAKGMITQALLNCGLTKILGEAVTTVIKPIGVAGDADSFIKAVKSGAPGITFQQFMEEIRDVGRFV